jgi:hypothetical protein
MPSAILRSLKPAASVRTHFLAAAVAWTVVGGALTVAGVVWCVASPLPWSAGLIVLGVALGAAKARWVLAAVARRNSARLVDRGDGHCLGGFVSWRGWLLIVGMMAAGFLLRNSGLPLPILGPLYVAVGTALLLGSLSLWRARASLPR